MNGSLNVGKYLASRLVSGGVTNFFTVPGDFTLALLDELQSETDLKLIGCCNELNAAYAADGYCRESGGIGCVIGKRHHITIVLRHTLTCQFGLQSPIWLEVCPL